MALCCFVRPWKAFQVQMELLTVALSPVWSLIVPWPSQKGPPSLGLVSSRSHPAPSRGILALIGPLPGGELSRGLFPHQFVWTMVTKSQVLWHPRDLKYVSGFELLFQISFFKMQQPWLWLLKWTSETWYSVLFPLPSLFTSMTLRWPLVWHASVYKGSVVHTVYSPISTS